MIKRFWGWFLKPSSRYSWAAIFIIGMVSGIFSWGGLNSYMGYSGIVDFCVSCGGESSKRFKQCKCEDASNGATVLLLDYEGAAKALSMTRNALRDLVYKGRGPVVTKIGSRTFFAVKDLEKFIEDHREGPTG